MTTAQTKLFHTLSYADAAAAITFLRDGLGFTEAACYTADGDPSAVQHAQMNWPGGGAIMFGSAATGGATGVARAYLVVDSDADVDRLHRQALDHGTTESRAPVDMDYGGRGSTVLDPEGNEWSLGSYTGE